MSKIETSDNLLFDDHFQVFLRNSGVLNSGQEKKYFYINIWSLKCNPCVEEIPLLIHLSKKWNSKVLSFLISPHSDKAVNSFLRKTGLKDDSIIYMNNMYSFILAIFKELEIGEVMFPTHIIMDYSGQILGYLIGTIPKQGYESTLVNFINGLS